MPETSQATINASVTQKTKQKTLLEQIVAAGRFDRDDKARERGEEMIEAFVDRILEEKTTISSDTEKEIDACLEKIDKLLSAQLNEILHDEKFQKLEATWRGLKYLMDQSETDSMLKIKILNVSDKDLRKDLRTAEWDQSALFKKVYEEEFGVFGGSPFGALIGDYHFGRGPEDMELLGKISNVAAAAHAPFLAAASPDLLNLEKFPDIVKARDIGKVFDTTDYIEWNSFRESDDSRYVGLVMPRILLRLPYGKKTREVEAFDYEEAVNGKNHDKYLWGNPAYALGARLTNAFSKYRWCAAIRGVKGGGMVEGLPTHKFTTDEGDVAVKCPTEVAITDRREKELADQGLIPLVHCKNTDRAAFFSVQSCNKPKKYDKAAAKANAQLSTQLPYILAMSRFAHYLKAMMRDRIGSFVSRDDCQRELTQWIHQYVCIDDEASQSIKAELPLREARIEVMDVPGKPGTYRAIAFLKPHFQLDGLTVSLRLVADLPTPQGAG